MLGFDSLYLVMLDGLTWKNEGKSVLMLSFRDFHGIITAWSTTETVIRYNHVRQAQVETESESRSESSTSEAETLFVRTWCHAEGLRLAGAAKLPPLLICLRATRQSREDRGKTERQKGVLRRGSKPGLERWIWMLAKGSQTVRIKGNQRAVRLRKASGI